MIAAVLAAAAEDFIKNRMGPKTPGSVILAASIVALGQNSWHVFTTVNVKVPVALDYIVLDLKL